MASATAHGASSASATADGTSAVTATEHDQDEQTVDLFYDLAVFLYDALVDACTWPLQDERPLLDLVFEKFEEWTKSRCHHALYN